MLIQDSTVVSAPATVGATITALWQLGFPYVVAWLFKKWNVAKGKLDGMSDFAKAAIYVAITFVGLQLFKLVGVINITGSAETWGVSAIADFVTAIFGTLMVKIGIASNREKSAQ